MSKFVHFQIPKDIDDSLDDLRKKTSADWEKLGKESVANLTNFTLRSVPGYKKFLKQHSIESSQIKSIDSFTSLPLVNKDNYLRKYKYIDLFPRRQIDDVSTISSTSGSTGEPYYFPRGEEQDSQYEYVAEIFAKNQFDIGNKKTLCINGFGMGIWIGGIFTYKIFNRLSAKGYKLAMAPVGRDKHTFLKTFKKMSPYFDQTILMGYPPFIKDILDEGPDYGIIWKKFDLKIMVATEGFSEKFREYLIKKAGLKNRFKDILNIYGSVELGTMSHETPISNLIRKIASQEEKVYKGLFPGARVIPTLVQYYPHIVYFEEVAGEVVASGYGSSFPLIRYQFFDRGGIYSFDKMVSKLSSLGIDILREAKKNKIYDTIFRLPFVYVHERSDFVVNLRGANIYPGNIRNALHKKNLQREVSGKFTMIVKEDKLFNEYLELNVEMRKGRAKSKKVKEQVLDLIVKTLLQDNSEFANLYSSEKGKATPRVILHDNEDPKYFSNKDIKQKWVIK